MTNSANQIGAYLNRRERERRKATREAKAKRLALQCERHGHTDTGRGVCADCGAFLTVK